MVLVYIAERHVAQCFIEHIFGIATGVDHVGSIDPISDFVAKLLAKRLHCLKCSGFSAFKFYRRVAKGLLAERIEHFADVLPSLRQ